MACTYVTDIEVHRALHALQEKRPPELHGIIAPNDTLIGRVHVALPHQLWGRIGGFTVTIEDEVGTQYVLRRDRRGVVSQPPTIEMGIDPEPTSVLTGVWCPRGCGVLSLARPIS